MSGSLLLDSNGVQWSFALCFPFQIELVECELVGSKRREPQGRTDTCTLTPALSLKADELGEKE